ncbi:MAG: two-component regulator propeller domain-containing protein, partial [Methanoregula sp.]
MGHQAISELIVVVIILLSIIPAMAFSDNSSSVSRENVTTTEPVPYTIKLFIPTTRMIHSDQITDLINGHNGDVIIATSFGISTYNGSWSTRHLNLDNISLGLMDDYVTAVEYDHDGNLWIGYSGGLQIYNGRYYRTIRDQQLLKETRILDLQRWNDEMWIATGHAGIHRYRNETWIWFQPGVKNGSGFYEVDSMALDPAGNMLVIATPEEGLWIVRP